MEKKRKSKPDKDYGIQVQVRMPDDLVDMLDKYREKYYRSRSSVIKEALAEFLKDRMK